MTSTPMKGWEREFWNLLSPETTERLKAELAHPFPCPSLRHPSEASAADPGIPSPGPSGSAVFKPGDRVRMEFGWEEHVDGVLLGYRTDVSNTARVRFDDDDCIRLISADRLSPAPPRHDNFGPDWSEKDNA